VVDVREEKTAVREANQLGIPVIAMCDTNVDPQFVETVIAANDDAIKSIEMILKLVSEAISAGRAAPKQAEANIRAAGVAAPEKPAKRAADEVAETPAAETPATA